jgi:hypothetical protein
MSRTHFIVLTSAIALLVFVLELVRRRRLKEEYSWLWLFAAVTYLLIALWPGFYTRVAEFIGAANATLAFTFLGLFFLATISIQYAVQLSRLTIQNKDLAQQLAILDGELNRITEALLDDISSDQSAEIKKLSDQSERLARRIATLDDELQTLIAGHDHQGAIAHTLEQQQRG